MKQGTLNVGRVLVWFSCGAASAVAAKLAVEQHAGEDVEVLYCDTLRYEHPDNRRFMDDVAKWIGAPIKILQSDKYADIFEVFRGERYLVGVRGAPCTRVLKRNVRRDYQNVADIHVFGLTADEGGRIDRFEADNPDIELEWNLRDAWLTKRDCLKMIAGAGIEIPAMYRLGYGNNNCIGCVKGGAGYWNKIRVDFPDAFARMAALEREIGARILKKWYLDELPKKAGRYNPRLDVIECGSACSSKLEVEADEQIERMKGME